MALDREQKKSAVRETVLTTDNAIVEVKFAWRRVDPTLIDPRICIPLPWIRATPVRVIGRSLLPMLEIEKINF